MQGRRINHPPLAATEHWSPVNYIFIHIEYIPCAQIAPHPTLHFPGPLTKHMSSMKLIRWENDKTDLKFSTHCVGTIRKLFVSLYPPVSLFKSNPFNLQGKQRMWLNFCPAN